MWLLGDIFRQESEMMVEDFSLEEHYVNFILNDLKEFFSRDENSKSFYCIEFLKLLKKIFLAIKSLIYRKMSCN